LSVVSEEIHVNTKGNADVIDITLDVGNRLDGSLTKGGQLRYNVVGINQLDDSVSNKLTDVNRIHNVPLLQQTLFNRVPAINVGSSPWGVAFDGTHMWVVNYGPNTDSKIDINTNTIVATVPVGSNPRIIAFDGTHMWVTNYSAQTASKIIKA